MTDERNFGDIGSRILIENERVRIWEMRLGPGERSALHHHEQDYIMIPISGDRIAAEFEPDAGGRWAGHQGIAGDVIPGDVTYAERGGRETAVNIGDEPFFEIIVELKD